MLPPRKTIVAGLAGIALSCSALAHSGAELHGHSAFISGLLHPLLGIDHICAMLAVGLWSGVVAQREARALLWGPLAFATLMLLGALLGLQDIQVPAVEPMIAASLVVLGLLLATCLRLSALPTALCVGGFALFHGLAHGIEWTNNSASQAPMLAGMLSATLLLHGCGLALGSALHGSRAWIARLTGSAIALLGAGLLLQLA